MTDETTLRVRTSCKDAAERDRHILEQLLMLMLVDSLWRKDKAGSAGDDDDGALKDMAKESMTIIRSDQSVFSQKRLAVTQQLLDAQFLRLMDEREEGRSAVSYSNVNASSSVRQLMDDAAAEKKMNKRAAAAAKKKRYKRNKAAAKHKKTKLMSSWMGGGIMSLIMVAAFGSIVTFVVPLSLIHPSDGSGEGEAPPALPPSASKSLSQKDLWKNEASTSPDIIRSPLAAVVPPPIFAPIAMGNRQKKFDKMRESMFTASAIDTDHPTSHNSNLPTYSPTNLPPTNSPMKSSSPTKSANPSSSLSSKPSSSPSSSSKPSSFPSISSSPTQVCLDTPNWEDVYGEGCDYYRGYGSCSYADWDAGDMGSASTHCCICGGGSHSLPPSNSPTITNSPTKSATPSSSSKPSSSPSSSSQPSSFPSISSSPTQVCVDTPNWENVYGKGCDYYRGYGSCSNADYAAGDMGSASTHCCICDGGSTTCEDFRSKCQKYINVLDLGFNASGLVAPLCKEAESCSCEEAADHDVKIVTDQWGQQETVGLHNECKCDFWSRLCEDTRRGEACDYAAEYCCGDYWYFGLGFGFEYLNSPTCYCDFFNYAQEEFGHTLKPKALNISEELDSAYACSQIQNNIAGLKFDGVDFIRKYERPRLEVIYNETNGQNWKNKAGWMIEPDHCQWHGITCDSDSFVTSIDLRDNNLAGQFPVYSRTYVIEGEPLPESWSDTKYGLANLYHLKTLDLANNKLTGTIEYRPLYDLYSLTHFDVSGNKLSGELDALVTPSLTYVDISNNNFTSMRRFEKYKVSPLQTLRFCDVSNNTIQNDASDLLENIPPNIEHFFAPSNQIYGSLPESFNSLQELRHFDMSSNALSGSLPESINSLPELRQFDMSSNALSGTLPGFADSILSLQQLDLSNQTNGFTGTIPADIWRFQSLKILNLAGNKLAGTIPPAIGNMAVLEVLDLSNNLVKTSIPSELGMLVGTLKRLGLANNTLSGKIPSQLGQLQGAAVLLNGNIFHNSSIAPLSLCLEREVKVFDLANDTTLCPIERNALSDFYDSAKGAEWTDGSLWLDEYASCCDWKGVTCENNQVTQLNLTNNGLSGKLSDSIGHLTFIEVMDLSDNDIKGSIPTEIGLLSELTYLRLSYNAFTGAAPEGLGELTQMKLLQLQSNRITEVPNIPELDDSKYDTSTFVTDCGVPSAFDEALVCEHCTMCCNANEDCYPQEDTRVAEWGLNYGTFAGVLFAGFIVLCCVVVFCLYLFSKRKNRGKALTMSMDVRLKKDDKYALSTIGKNSVYSYFVTNQVVGWLTAVTTLGLQVGILAVFVMASEANLQDDTIDIQFTWKCPRDSDVCEDKGDLTKAGWAIFSMLMIAYLAKDVISGSKLLYHSSKSRHPLRSRIRYFIGGLGLCSITLFAFYISTVYNKAIATSNTEIIVNSVIVLFVMEMDEWIFSALEASNKKWTEHVADSESSSDSAAEKGAEIDEMQEEIAVQKEQIADQQVELEMLRSQQEELMLRLDQLARQNDEIKMLREAVQKMETESPASESIPLSPANESVTTHIAESGDTRSDIDAGEDGTMNEVGDEDEHQKDETD